MTPESKPLIPMVVLDWAGTVVDHGSVAPVKALEDIFAAEGIDAPHSLVRKYMGLAKRDHVEALLWEPEIAAQVAHLHARRVTEEDVDRLYAQFEPQMMALLPGYAEVITGAAEVVEELRSRGIRLGGTTGYTRPMLDELMQLAAKQGYRTDASLCPEDVGAGRPHPWMCYRLAIDLRVYPLSRCVKVGDTPSDIEEGRNAGMWTIGLTRSGNAVGLTETEWKALDAPEQKRLLADAEKELRGAGAHLMAESVAHILPVLGEIEERIRTGELPL
ncbi:phosphonoacetaldehyde hydrolase [Acidicapsa dinghuensis]|uniref:Phosphonoacetaldehyde hydrolase n=1 Tax=Acidicapsa dinghuensis TaxID=2218256 RepID=A0ABW1EC30_9BACT|nr:phosphonoacetaldehyde hydrolase [Acidicapsa dinghuensis]